MSDRPVQRSARRTAFAAAAGVAGATAAFASPSGAVVPDETYISVSPQTDIVADRTPVTVTWTDSAAGPMTVDLCDLSSVNGCVSVYSSSFVNFDGSVTRTIPGRVNGKTCVDATATSDIDCVLEVRLPGETARFQVSFTPPSSK